MDKVVLIRLSGEITLKSPGILRAWINTLMKNIRKRLHRKGLEKPRITYRAGRIFIEADKDIEKIHSETQKVFGVKETILCIRIPNDLDSIIGTAVELTRNWAGTFAVRTNRIKEYPLTSLEVNRIVGEEVIRNNGNLRVDLTNPDNVLEIEIREHYAYIFEKKLEGFGGLPYGVSGKGVALVSGGIDSSLAAWLMMKRGMRIVIVHVDLSPYYSEDAKKRFFDVLDWFRDWIPSGRLKTYIVPIGDVHANVRLPALRYRCLFCKMLMLRIAEYIARRERAHAIITGEVLSQVASQTPVNMMAISSVVDLPILRPMVFMDKNEIDSLAQRIGLYSIVARDVGKCRLVPKRPATEIDPQTAETLASLITKSIISDVIGKAEKIY